MRWKLLFIGFPAALLLFLFAVWLTTPNVSALKSTPPGDTAFMRLRREEAAAKGRKLNLRHTWRPLGQISKNLQHAVIVAEDAAFYDHAGIDLAEMRASFVKNLRKLRLARGGSTITQQLAKNLYLSPSRNPVRKVREIAIAFALEHALTKDRILELYLNSIEWGDGIFGAEAAARAYFGTSAARLSEAQAATLAALIPNPRRFAKQMNGKRVQTKENLILRRMRRRFAPEDEPSAVRVVKAKPPPKLAGPPDDGLEELNLDDEESEAADAQGAPPVEPYSDAVAPAGNN